MRKRLTIIIIALALLIAGAAVAHADIGTVLWKMHCPASASVIPHEAMDGGVDVVCIRLVRSSK